MMEFSDKKSSDHPTVQAFRSKLDSIAEHSAVALSDVVERAKALRRKSDAPPEKARPPASAEVPEGDNTSEEKET